MNFELYLSEFCPVGVKAGGLSCCYHGNRLSDPREKVHQILDFSLVLHHKLENLIRLPRGVGDRQTDRKIVYSYILDSLEMYVVLATKTTPQGII